jgi:hypothetical protein
LQTSTLPVLFKQAPHLAAERTAIEQFYDRSNLRFFGGAPSRVRLTELRALAATLRRLEKQYER